MRHKTSIDTVGCITNKNPCGNPLLLFPRAIHRLNEKQKKKKKKKEKNNPNKQTKTNIIGKFKCPA